MIIVRFNGCGATMPSDERQYPSVQAAQAANWYPVGADFGHRLYKDARLAGYARDGRCSVRVEK